jgi:TatA/E family protein of Tat protein translocase
MLGIGFPEMLLIMAIALLVFGPKKLPEIGKSLGKAIREFKRSSDELKERFEEEVRVDEFKSVRDELKKDIEVDEEK